MDFSPENTDDEFLAWFNNNGFKLITIDVTGSGDKV